MAKEKLSRSRELGSKVIFAALQILSEMGGQASGREVISQVEKRVILDDWAKATYEKSGYIRWQSMLHFFSIDCIKAGYLVKKKGVWYLTRGVWSSIWVQCCDEFIHSQWQQWFSFGWGIGA